MAEVDPVDDGLIRGRPDIAYDLLRADIVQGELLPNERLVEADLAKRLSVSRATVRAALARLEQDGLVVREYNRGVRVRRVTEAEAIEILQARIALEALAASEAAKKATVDDIFRMRSALTEMAACYERGDLMAASAENGKLHAEVLRVAGNKTVTRLLEGLKAQVVRYQFRTGLVPGRPALSLAEHTAIVDAIAAGDSDAAEAAMRTHLSHVAEAIDSKSRAVHWSIDPVL